MRELRLQLRLFVAAVVAAGALAIALALPASVDPGALVVAGILFALATVAKLFPLHLSPKLKVTVDDPATFAAALSVGPFLAMLVAGGSALLGQRTRQGSWYSKGFNAAVVVLGTGAAAFAYEELRGVDRNVMANPAALLVAGIAKYLIETGLVDTVVGVQLHRNPLATWWPIHRRDMAQHASLYLLGVLAAFLAVAAPWAVVLVAVPMGVVFLSLRESTRLREQTRAAILELADLVDLRDPYTHGHSQRTAALAERLARRMKLQPSQIELVREAARLHDIGKIGTHDHVLQKPGPLDEHERVEMRRHSELGAQFLRRLPEFWEGANLVLSHHERPDGRGYPRRLRGDELPLESGIIAVADTYDAMTTDRPYRKAMPWEEARAELVEGRGTQWDGRVVDAFIEMIEEDRRAPAPTRVPAPASALR